MVIRVLLVLAIAMTPVFGDTPDTRLSSVASIGQDVTPVSLTARPASSQNPLFTTPHLACDAVPVPHHAPIHSPRPELAFGGVAASFTHLHCLLGVFRI